MDELDATSEEEEEEEGEAEGETEGDEMEDEMTDVWWKTRPYCSQPLPVPAATLSNHLKHRKNKKRVAENVSPTHFTRSLSGCRDQSQRGFPFKWGVCVCVWSVSVTGQWDDFIVFALLHHTEGLNKPRL